jgi:hypothetical protein
MWIVRSASMDDLSTIYSLQNSSHREEALDSELPSFDQFFEERRQEMMSGQEKYFLLENAGVPAGFVALSLASDFWNARIWGRWLRTLVYAGSSIAFDHLQLPRLVFGVRETNRRMNKVCKDYDFRTVGENSVIVTFQDPPYVGVARILYYDLTAEEFHARSQLIRQHSFPLQFQLSQ